MKYYTSTLVFIIATLLIGCTPHPTSGVWKATEDNEYGIDRLVLAFDGKATFTTTKLENADWHCFWTAISNNKSELKCAPSTNPDLKERYSLTVDNQAIAILQHNDKQIAIFMRQNENLSPNK